MKVILLLCMTLLLAAKESNVQDHVLTIHIKNIPSSNGKIWVALYNQEEGFLEKEKAVKSTNISAQKGNMELTIDKIPAGKYAVAVFHDANGNDELDKNLIGAPSEPYGFSNNAKGIFGPPSFNKASFTIDKNKTITITLR